jgi:hypothetical protein
MKTEIKRLLKETVKNNTKYEYQVRDINGLVFYKRKVGDDEWVFINDEEFVKDAPGNNLIKWDKDEKIN